MQEKREVSFDATFFGIHRGQAIYLDPMTRMFLEKTFEAVIDAGTTSDYFLIFMCGVCEQIL